MFKECRSGWSKEPKWTHNCGSFFTMFSTYVGSKINIHPNSWTGALRWKWCQWPAREMSIWSTIHSRFLISLKCKCKHVSKSHEVSEELIWKSLWRSIQQAKLSTIKSAHLLDEIKPPKRIVFLWCSVCVWFKVKWRKWESFW